MADAVGPKLSGQNRAVPVADVVIRFPEPVKLPSLAKDGRVGNKHPNIAAARAKRWKKVA